MRERNINVLLVEDDPLAAQLFLGQLGRDAGSEFLCERAENLAQAIRQVRAEPYDVVVLDLMLPDSAGLETLARLRAEAEHLPIVVLTGLDDERTALEALERGAQDYLVKGELSPRLISRSIRYSIERQRLTEALRSLSLLDELTGLYNRRGFRTLAEQELKVAQRMERGVALIFADVLEFKRINDEHGHLVGDQALRRVAELLRRTFRSSDLLARFGGDEFIVFTIHAQREGIQKALERLRANLKRESDEADAPYELDLSLGVEWVGRDEIPEIDDLLARADQELVEAKRRRKSLM